MTLGVYGGGRTRVLIKVKEGLVNRKVGVVHFVEKGVPFLFQAPNLYYGRWYCYL